MNIVNIMYSTPTIRQPSNRIRTFALNPDSSVDDFFIGQNGFLKDKSVLLLVFNKINCQHGFILMRREVGSRHDGLIVILEESVSLPFFQSGDCHSQLQFHWGRAHFREDANLRGFVVQIGLHAHRQTLGKLVYNPSLSDAVVTDGEGGVWQSVDSAIFCIGVLAISDEIFRHITANM